jgi:hypothetical protein
MWGSSPSQQKGEVSRAEYEQTVNCHADHVPEGNLGSVVRHVASSTGFLTLGVFLDQVSPQSAGLFTVPNIVEVLLEEIPQNRLSLEVPTTRHDISVASNHEREPRVGTQPVSTGSDFVGDRDETGLIVEDLSMVGDACAIWEQLFELLESPSELLFVSDSKR